MRPVVKLFFAGHLAAGEALVVAQVEVGLGAVVGDEHLAVLERAHGARVDVDVRVELEVLHLEPAVLQQRADRGGGEPLAERADHAAGDEQVLRLLAALHHGLRYPLAGRPRGAPARAPGPPACRCRTRGRWSRPPGCVKPCSSARSCSSDSSCSSEAGRERRERARGTSAVKAYMPTCARACAARCRRARRTGMGAREK